MAIQQLFTGTAGKTDYIITAFEFLKPGDIEITVGTDVKTSPSHYSIEGSTIKFTSVPTVGATIKAERSTDISTKSHTYTAGSSITAQTLNDNQDQALFKIEEVKVDAVNAADLTGDHGAINVSSNGGTWTIKQNTIDGDHIQESIIKAKHIDADAVGTSEIATNAVGADELDTNAVYTNAIQDDAVTYSKLQNIETANRVLGRASAGQVQEVQVGTEMIAEDAVKQSKIENAAVNEAKLQISNTPDNKNGYVLTCQSGNTGGLTWAPAPTVGGSILETVSYICDGKQFTQRGRNYNIDAYKVDSAQVLAGTATVTGSTVEYLPPEGTKTVVYEFAFTDAYVNSAAIIWHAELYFDSLQVYGSKFTKYADGGSRNIMKWPIHIGTLPEGSTVHPNTTQDQQSGRIPSWTSPKTFHIKARSYNESNFQAKLHQTAMWNGQVSSQLSLPTLTLTAIS